MKHYLYLGLVGLLLAVPSVVGAQGTQTPTTPEPFVAFRSIDDIINKACYVADILFTAAIILTIVFVLLAAIKYITKGSDPKAVSDAHQQLIWAAVGFGIAVLSGVVPGLVASFLGASAGTC